MNEVAAMIGCSPWTVRQKHLPRGLPFFRSAASGKLIFYEAQVIRWIEKQQGGINGEPLQAGQSLVDVLLHRRIDTVNTERQRLLKKRETLLEAFSKTALTGRSAALTTIRRGWRRVSSSVPTAFR